MVSLCSPGWPQTCDSLASISPFVTGLQVCTTWVCDMKVLILFPMYLTVFWPTPTLGEGKDHHDLDFQPMGILHEHVWKRLIKELSFVQSHTKTALNHVPY
jgi:hypothetical protein